MKLVKIIPERTHNGKSSININISGVMRLSGTSVEILKLKTKDTVTFYNDKDNPKDWYIKPHEKEGGVTLRNSTKGSMALLANNASIAKKILDSISLTKSAHMIVATKANLEGCYAIITRSAKGS